MGLLDGLFGNGQQQQQQGQPQQQQHQGIAPDTFWDRFRAQYAPGAYAAHQGNLQQQAIYSAMLQKGASPEQAQALAMSPQFFQAGQGAYLPQAPGLQIITNSDGSQTPVQIGHPGGGPNQSLTLSGIPITAPGTTSNPTQAAGANRPAPVQDNTQGTANAGPTNTLQGMPGSTQATLDAIDRAKAAGADPFSVVPNEFRNITQAVVDGKMTLNEIPQVRGSRTREIISKLAQQIDPEFSEAMNEARNTYRKQYVSGRINDIGGQVKSINKLAGHAEAMADAATNVGNYGLGGFGGVAHPINEFKNNLYTTNAAGLKSAADKYVAEKNTYLAGRAGGTDKAEREARREEYSGAATPQEMGTALLSDIDFIEKQMAGNEEHRNEVFKNTKTREEFSLASPEARQHLNQAKIKAHKLLGDYDQWSQSEEGAKVTGQAPQVNPTLPNGWRLKQ